MVPMFNCRFLTYRMRTLAHLTFVCVFNSYHGGCTNVRPCAVAQFVGARSTNIDSPGTYIPYGISTCHDYSDNMHAWVMDNTPMNLYALRHLRGLANVRIT